VDQPLVGIVMGSKSDWATMQQTSTLLRKLGIAYEVRVFSAHRTPQQTAEYATAAEDRGIEVLIGAAGGAAALPGVIAANTILPVLGAPMQTSSLNGMDSLLSMVQMPRGIPVGTLAIGDAGASNAALLAAAILAIKHPDIRDRLRHYRQTQTKDLLAGTTIAGEP